MEDKIKEEVKELVEGEGTASETETPTETKEETPTEISVVEEKKIFEDDFELLSSYTNDHYSRITKVLNVNGGCIVNTIILKGEEVAVSSLYIPSNHIRNGQIGPM